MLPLRLPAAAGALATAGLTTLALAGPAAAAPEYYGVTVDATVQVSYTGHADDQEFKHDSSLATSTHLTSGFLAVIDRGGDGHIVGASGEDQHHAVTTSSIALREKRWSTYGAGSWYELGHTCAGTVANRNDEGRTSLRTDPLTLLGGAGLILNLADRLDVETTNCQTTGRDGSGSGLGNFRIESPVPDDELGPAGPMSVRFVLPPEATTAGKTIQLFKGPEGGEAAYCPADLQDSPYLVQCRVTFKGQITFERTDLGITPPGPPAPGPAPKPSPAPSPQPAPKPPVTDDDDLLAPLVPAAQKVRVGAKGASLSFRAACPAGCSGTATVRVPVAKGKGRSVTTIAAKTRTLATVKFSVGKSAKARAVRVAVPKAVRAKLRRAKGATVVLALKDRGTKRTTKATLKLAR